MTKNEPYDIVVERYDIVVESSHQPVLATTRTQRQRKRTLRPEHDVNADGTNTSNAT